jgi:hypothetical protein
MNIYKLHVCVYSINLGGRLKNPPLIMVYRLQYSSSAYCRILYGMVVVLVYGIVRYCTVWYAMLSWWFGVWFIGLLKYWYQIKTPLNQ